MEKGEEEKGMEERRGEEGGEGQHLQARPGQPRVDSIGDGAAGLGVHLGEEVGVEKKNEKEEEEQEKDLELLVAEVNLLGGGFQLEWETTCRGFGLGTNRICTTWSAR